MADQTPPEAAPAKAGGTNKLVLVAGIVGAAAISGGATFFLTKPAKDPAAKTKKVAAEGAAHGEGGEGQEEVEEPEDESKVEHPVVNLPSFLVNLGEDLNDQHYLKVSIAVELGGVGEEAAKEFEGKTAKVRSAVLMYLSTLKAEDVSGAENRKKILDKMRSEVRRSVGSKVARNVYLTEMVVQ